MQKLKILLLLSLFLLNINACHYFHAYQPAFSQGNVLNSEDIDELKPGMSPQQVEAILGTPIYDDSFASDHLTYVYASYKNGNQKEYHEVTVYFKNNRLSHIERKD